MWSCPNWVASDSAYSAVHARASIIHSLWTAFCLRCASNIRESQNNGAFSILRGANIGRNRVQPILPIRASIVWHELLYSNIKWQGKFVTEFGHPRRYATLVHSCWSVSTPICVKKQICIFCQNIWGDENLQNKKTTEIFELSTKPIT